MRLLLFFIITIVILSCNKDEEHSLIVYESKNWNLLQIDGNKLFEVHMHTDSSWQTFLNSGTHVLIFESSWGDTLHHNININDTFTLNIHSLKHLIAIITTKKLLLSLLSITS